ncbi:hypothetical protein LEN26_015771 [Aphanomyces euteiches]|nr:hypothetical protein LEN26_015771 [Aphanomyces euteiches]
MKLFAIGKGDVRMRLDRWLKANFQRPQSFFQRHLRQKQIFLYDVPTQRRVKTRADFILEENPALRIGMTQTLYDAIARDAVSSADPVDPVVPPELALPILYEDSSFVALHKPPRLATQLGTSTDDSVASRYPHWKLVHRLDKGTSGILLLAKTRLAAADMAALFRNNLVQKTYIAQVHGHLTALTGVIDAPLDDQSAKTSFRVLKVGENYTTWLELQPHTGRKHQLRRHCADFLKTPIVGDKRYGLPSSSSDRPSRLMLHASSLSFIHPTTHQRVVISCKDPTFHN